MIIASTYSTHLIADRPCIAFRSTWTYLRLPSSANRALENPQSSRPSLELLCLVHLEPALGTYWLIYLSSHVLMSILFYSCPTECRLSRSPSPWQCVVSLRFTSNSEGQVRNEDFGPIIHDKAQVEDRIRRAQRAILNPSKPSKQFLVDIDDIQDSELSFSSNCVSLQISGPDVADLSFCDLPGAFFFVPIIFLFLSLICVVCLRPHCHRQ